MLHDHDTPESDSPEGFAEIELLVDGFEGAGLDGQLLARIYVDHEPSQPVTFRIGEVDQATGVGATESDVERLWQTALSDMTGRLQQELSFTGVDALRRPITVTSHLATASPRLTPHASEFTEPGSLLAQFTI